MFTFRPQFRRRAAFLLLNGLLLAMLVAGAGCGATDKLDVVSETDEKEYQRGKEWLTEDKSQEALTAFLHVILQREALGEDAPESHLEVGQLYLKINHDPIEAIHHFKKYLESKPDSPQAPMVRQLIETATKDFIKALPGHPDTGDDDRLDLLDQNKRLQADNDDLRKQLAQQHPTGVSLQNPTPITNLNRLPPVATTPRGTSSAHMATPPVMPVAVVPVTPVAQPVPATPAPSSTSHTYTVVGGDTLSNISMKVYGTKSRWQEILNANHDQLPSEKSPLHVGMVLKIP